MKIFQSNLSSCSRQVEKRVSLYRWLGEFRYCEAEIVAKLLGIGLRQSQIFLKQLVDDSLVARRKISLSLTKQSYLYYLTKAGHQQWLEIESHSARFSNQKRALDSSLVRHNIYAQHALLDLLDLRPHISPGDFEICGISDLTRKFKGGRCPDAHLSYKKASGEEVKLVLEYEHAPKSAKRIQWILMQHLKQILDDDYHIVYFYFQNASVQTMYEKHFQKKEWPVVEKINYHYKQSKQPPIKVHALGDLSERFYFKTLDNLA